MYDLAQSGLRQADAIALMQPASPVSDGLSVTRRILSLGSSAIGILVDCTMRFTMLLHLLRMAGHGKTRVIRNNSPAVAGHGVEAVVTRLQGPL